MRTILFAGDDRVTREACRRELEDDGYRVILARDAAQAVDLWRSERPDVVILDNLIPRKGALEAAEEISSLDPDTPIILYMGYDDTYVRDPRARFFIACVEKSGDLAELKLAVARVFAPRDQGRLPRSGLPPA
jgi:DNA-binding NtrC family response regulator